MNNFWNPVAAGAASGILSAMALGVAGQLVPLGSRLIFPDEAVIAMTGECPLGWHRYEAASGRYVVAADGRALEAGTIGQVNGTSIEFRDGELRGKGEIILSAPARQPPNQSERYQTPVPTSSQPAWSYIALNLCQRR